MPVPKQNDESYCISLSRGDRALRISASDKAWVDAKLEELKDWLALPPLEPETVPGAPEESVAVTGKIPSLAEHVRAVGPTGGLEHVLAVGYYLERYSRLQGGFRRRDLAEAFKAVRYQHSNPGVPIATARRQGLLMDGEEHEKLLLTETAERWVEDRLGA